MLIYSSIFTQDINNIIIDEKYDEPILIGKCNRDAFKDSNFVQWFDEEYNIYRSFYKNKVLLREKLSKCKITIVMGTWCSDSKREVPGLYKILDELEYQDDKILLINVDHSKNVPNDLIEGLEIEFVPTIIVYMENKEIGRIIEVPENTLESDLEMFFQIKKTSD